MSTLPVKAPDLKPPAPARSERLAQKSALVIGLGGLGCPSALALARAGVGRLVLCDDDIVDVSNLHRQILYSEADVGRHKLDAAREALLAEGAQVVDVVRSRFLPENSRTLVQDMDVVLEGADNFATKFLTADTCFLEGVPVVHGAAIRFQGTAFSVKPTGRPCYRCLFEDLLPAEQAPNCNGSGVFGPVVGVVGALVADLALDVLLGQGDRQNSIFSFDGKKLTMRSVAISPRLGCPLCGNDARAPRIESIERDLYTSDAPLSARLGVTSRAADAQVAPT
jgi:molybdopterin/thiamine biosynthesis adenylyltransferase